MSKIRPPNKQRGNGEKGATNNNHSREDPSDTTRLTKPSFLLQTSFGPTFTFSPNPCFLLSKSDPTYKIPNLINTNICTRHRIISIYNY